ncbi:MAG: hypothetical protein K2L07_00675 [Lachnospiraceae bacterium]|nr:hypothetical protein [Lachnospiraceae bacterium]
MKRNYLGIRILILTVLMIGALSPKIVAFAGEINSNEARVISAASGTFIYDGKIYKAGTAYINSLISYLSADDVDLSAEQADEAISMMYANIAEGVNNGYLYEVGGDNNTQQTEESTTEAGQKPGADGKTDIDGKEGQDKNTTEDKMPSDDEMDVWDAMSNQTEAKKELSKRPEKQSADAEVKLEGSDIVITTKDKKKVSFSRNENIVSDQMILAIDGIAIILLVITLICGIILFATKCMTFRKNRKRKARPGHSKRRKIRHNTRAVLTVTTAISLFWLLMMVGIYVSLFNKDAIMQNMQSSGYFRYAYSEYVSEFATDALELDDIESLKEEAKQIKKYEDFLFDVKQNSIMILNGNLDVRIPDSNVTPYIYNLKQSFVRMFQIAGICVILNIIFGIFFMIFMDQRRERGVKHTAFAMLLASVVMIGITLVMMIGKPYQNIYIEPDYLYLFLMECVKRTVMIMTSVTAFGVVIGMLLVGAYKTLAGSRAE